MADLAYTNVTISFLLKDMWRKQRANTVQISYGNGALTYPTNGVPLGATVAGALKRLGMGRWCDLELLQVPKDGYLYLFDQTLFTLRKFQTASHTPTGTAAGQVFTGDALATHQHNLTDGSLIYPWVPGGGDIKGSANTDSMLVDEAGKPTNADIVDTLHAVLAGPAWAYSEDAEVGTPRNVCILLKGKAATGSVIPAGDYKFTVTGLFRGAAQTEVITFTFAAVEGTIAADQHRYVYGVKPYDTVTSVVINATDLADLPVDLLIGVGIGSKLGYPVDSDTGAEADFLKITKNAANLAVTGLVNVTNKTVNLDTLADGDDVGILYLIDFDQGPTAAVSAGTPSGSNAASALTIALVAAGVLTEVPGAHAPAATVIRARAIGI